MVTKIIYFGGQKKLVIFITMILILSPIVGIIFFPNVMGTIFFICASAWALNALLSPFGEFRWIEKSPEERREYMRDGWFFYIVLTIPMTLAIVFFSIQWISCTWLLECGRFDKYGNCEVYLVPPPGLPYPEYRYPGE